MVYVVVSGLPKNVKYPKFFNYLEQVVFGGRVTAKLVNTEILRDEAVKKIILSMRSNDARKAFRTLNGRGYLYNGMEFPLQCWTEDEPKPEQASQYNRDRSDRSRSPPRNNVEYVQPTQIPMAIQGELDEIAVKIELTRKQRLLLEEENRLLLAKKKAEMLENIGPNDYEKLANYEKACGGNTATEVAESQTAQAKRTTKPNVRQCCFKIISEMQDIIRESVDSDNSDILMPVLSSTVKKRVIDTVNDSNAVATPDIINLYRVKYPASTDKSLMDEVIQKVRQTCLPKTYQANNATGGEKSNETENKDAAGDLNETMMTCETEMHSSVDETGLNENDGGKNETGQNENENEVAQNEHKTDQNETKIGLNENGKNENEGTFENQAHADQDFDEWLDNPKDDVEPVQAEEQKS